MRDVYVAGIGMTRFAKQPHVTLKELTAAVVESALEDAALPLGAIDAVYFGNATAGAITRQEMVKGQVFLRPLGFEGVPIVNVENACASASSAFHLAWLAVASGECEVALAIGAEKMSHPDKRVTFEAIGRGTDVELASTPVDGRSPLMDSYAEAASAYLEASCATLDDFAAVVVKNQSNGAKNPLAQYGASLTVDDVLSSREIVFPLTLFMCSPISDGAAAAVLTARPARVRVAASVLKSGLTREHAPKKGAWLAAEEAYARAGIAPEDVDVVEVHDAAAPAELQLYEQIGLAPFGEGARLIRAGHVRLDGRIPVNTSGGLLARGHPIGATGLAQIVELVLQLRDAAGPRQVAGAKVGLAQNGGGWHDGDNLAHCVTILAS
jgi:acetyl-CoA acetyltransferase